MTTQLDIVNKAREYIGTPFHHQARLKGIGIDCAGLLICVARELGLQHYDVQGYNRTPSGREFEMHLDANLDKIDAIETGCILLMAFDSEPQHVAICTSEATMIHAYLEVRKCVEHNIDSLWKSRIRAIYKFRGVTQ